MKKALSLLLLGLVLATPIKAQQGNTTTIRFAGAPTGNCAPLTFGINTATGALYDCVAGAWHLVGGGGVGITGSIANTQVAVGSGVNTIAGSSALTWTGTFNITPASSVNAQLITTNDATGITIHDVMGAASSGVFLSASADGSGGGVAGSDGTHTAQINLSLGNISLTPAGTVPLVSVLGPLAVTTIETIGSDNSVAGTLLLANSAAAAHTVWGSGATTTNTINGFAAVPTTGHLLDCTVTSTSCLLHDSGIATAAVTQTIASGAKALATGAIASTACNIDTATATGAATTDVVDVTFNANIDGTTGYTPATTGSLRITAYATSNQVNFSVCNPTALSITPGAVTLNWAIRR